MSSLCFSFRHRLTLHQSIAGCQLPDLSLCQGLKLALRLGVRVSVRVRVRNAEPSCRRPRVACSWALRCSSSTPVLVCELDRSLKKKKKGGKHHWHGIATRIWFESLQHILPRTLILTLLTGCLTSGRISSTHPRCPCVPRFLRCRGATD